MQRRLEVNARAVSPRGKRAGESAMLLLEVVLTAVRITSTILSKRGEKRSGKQRQNEFGTNYSTAVPLC